MTPEVEVQIRAEISNLKEFLAERDLRYQEKFEAASQALRIQANEYERRLGALNGEAARLREIQATYLPRELYDANQKELCKRVDNINIEMSHSEGKSSGISATWAVIVMVIVLGVSIASIIISLVK